MKWQWKLAGDFYFSFIYEIKAKVFATTRFSSDLTRHIDRRSDEYVKPLLLWNHHISDWPTAKHKKTMFTGRWRAVCVFDLIVLSYFSFSFCYTTIYGCWKSAYQYFLLAPTCVANQVWKHIFHLILWSNPLKSLILMVITWKFIRKHYCPYAIRLSIFGQKYVKLVEKKASFDFSTVTAWGELWKGKKWKEPVANELRILLWFQWSCCFDILLTRLLTNCKWYAQSVNFSL